MTLQQKPDYRPPLAERMRPRSFAEVAGQEELLGGAGTLVRLLREGRPPSLIFWGPPGCGKTTIARIIADTLAIPPVTISAVTSGVREVKEIADAARASVANGGPPTLLFVDEIHRFNKAQQDAFLAPVEDGVLILIGATTENPSFELNPPLLSRCRVLVLHELDRRALEILLDRALADRERGLGALNIALAPDARALLLDSADGDARALLTDLEWIATGLGGEKRAAIDAAPVNAAPVDAATARKLLARRLPRYDKAGEEHFNIISALHKSLRGGDEQAGLYWLARMLEAGEDPLYVARRLIRFASEDVGLADPQALPLAIAARDAVHALGMPECALALAELVVYLATAPKSNAVYRAYDAAAAEVRATGTLPVPLEIRNAPTRLMKEIGYGAGYRYPHDDPLGLLVPFLPKELRARSFYKPGSVGFEKEIARRIEYYAKLRAELRGVDPP